MRDMHARKRNASKALLLVQASPTGHNIVLSEQRGVKAGAV